MKRATIDRLRRALLGTGLLGSLLLLASCGVTEPSNEGWQDVSEFSWPTEVGTTMTFRKSSVTENRDTVTDIFDIVIAEPTEHFETPFGTLEYVLEDETKTGISMIHFLPTRDVLVARRGPFGGEIAILLKAPLEQGHRWYTSSDSTWEAEVVNLYTVRKIEGTLYEDVVAVRYRSTDPNLDSRLEYIRFYARGVGEVMTITSSFGQTSSGHSTNGTLEEKNVLIATQPAS